MISERTRPDATPRWRLFVALPVPPDAAAAIADSLTAYHAAFPDARWQPPELLHVTVRFLGGVLPEAAPDIARAIASVAASAPPLELATGRGGGGARSRDATRGVTWLTLERGAPDVRSVCASLDPLLPLDALGTPELRRPPDAHVTIARRASSGLIRALRDQALGPTDTAWTAERIVLYRSHTGTPSGSRYETLAEARLRVRAAA